MIRLSLYSTDKRWARDDDWLLTLDKEGGTLEDPDGETRATFSRAEAASRFTFPSFWASVKELGIQADAGGILWFVPETKKVEKINTYLHRALAAQGPEAIQAMRRKGWLMILGGATLALIGLVVTVVTLALAFSSPRGGTYVVCSGLIVFSLIVIARGVSVLVSAQRASARSEEP